MLDFLEQLRAKPKQTRKRIAFFTSSAIFTVIFFGWAFSRQPVADMSHAVVLTDATEPLAFVANTFMSITEFPDMIVSEVVANIPEEQLPDGSHPEEDRVLPDDDLPSDDQFALPPVIFTSSAPPELATTTPTHSTSTDTTL